MDLAEYLVRLRNRSLTGTSSTIEPQPAEDLNDYDLGGVDCDLCHNTGMITCFGEDGQLVSRQCACMKKRVAMRRIRQSGMSDLLSGKSHICTAICRELIERNRDVYYMPWRDESTGLKSMITDSYEYERRMRKLKRVEVLYIDDFLKGGDSDADIRLAYEILNFRYNDTGLRTILSSETDLKTLLKRDEALGGRVYERARGYVLQAPAKNMRFEMRQNER